MPVSVKSFVDGFSLRYEEKFGKQFYVNSYHVTLAGRICPHYTPTKINKALDFYFANYANPDVVEFFNKICSHFTRGLLLMTRVLYEMSIWFWNVSAFLSLNRNRSM